VDKDEIGDHIGFAFQVAELRAVIIPNRATAFPVSGKPIKTSDFDRKETSLDRLFHSKLDLRPNLLELYFQRTNDIFTADCDLKSEMKFFFLAILSH
jgi:hypothetical protein